MRASLAPLPTFGVIRRIASLAGLALALVACNAAEDAAVPGESCEPGAVFDEAGECVPRGCELQASPAADVVVHPGESIQDAADALGYGVLGLTGGRWTENLTLTGAHEGLTIVGRCPALTVIDGVGGGQESATIDITARNHQSFTLASLTITGGQRSGIEVGAADLLLSKVAVIENHALGLHATEGANVVLRDVEISHQLANFQHAYGEGASLSKATLDAERVTMDDNRLAGFSLDHTDARLVDVTVTGTHGPNAPQDGMGMWVLGGDTFLANVQLNGNDCAGLVVSEGARVEGAAVTLQGNGGYGMVAKDAGTVVAFSDSAIGETPTFPDGAAGIGVGVADGATLTLTDSSVRGNALDGIVAVDGADVTLVRVEIAGAGLDAPNAGLGVQIGAASGVVMGQVWIHDVLGYGLRVLAGGSAVLSDSRVVDNAGTGVAVSESGSSVEVYGGEISRTANESDNAVGTAVQVSAGASFDGEDVSLSDNAGIGIAAFNQDTHVTLANSVVRRTGAGLVGLGTGGVRLEDGADVLLRSVVVEDNLAVGVGAQDSGTLVRLDNVLISHTRSGPDYVGGEGVWVGPGAELIGQGVQLDDNHVAGFGVSGGSLSVEDCIVSGTRVDDRSPGGGAVAVQAGGDATLHRCVLVGNEYLSANVADADSSLVFVDVSVVDPMPYTLLDIAVGAIVSGGAALRWDGGVIDGVSGAAVMATGPGTTALLHDLTMVDTHAAFGDIGVAMEVTAGATLHATALDVHDTQGSIAAISGEGSAGTISDSTFSRTSPCPAYGDALGVIAHSGGRAELFDVTFTENDGPALIGGTGGAVTCTRCVISGSTFAGAAVSGGSLVLNASSIAETRPDHSFGGGVGIYARGAEGATELTLSDTSVTGSPVAGLWLDGPDAVTVDGCEIAGGPQVVVRDDVAVLGNAIFARGVLDWDGVRGLRVSDSRLYDAADAAVLLDASSAEFSSVEWVDNGIDVVQQRCEGVDAPSGLDGASVELCESGERLTLPLFYDTFLTESVPLSE